jgi:hypothetical protein
MEGDEVPVLLMLLRAVMASRKSEDQRILALQLAELTRDLGVIR